MAIHIDTGTEHLRAVVADGVATLILNNPERHNAITAEMFAGFGNAAVAIEQLGDVRVVVLRGAGDKAFASGADISKLSESAAQPNGLPLLAALPIPVVASIHGWCIGGGLMTALHADLRIASDDARFGIPAAKLGVGYPLDAAATLVRTVGESAAAEMLLLGDTFGADVALTRGLVHRVVPRSELTDATTELVEQLAANAPLSMAATKASITAAADPSHRGQAQTAIAATWSSRDFAEGRAAFGDRRPPEFNGT